tara:strand:- start:35 stop:1231 length:1197 start_codon:yes stop_codon:yes gene_type:complete
MTGFFVIFPFADEISEIIFNNEISGYLLKLAFISGCFQYYYLYFINILTAQGRANYVSFILVFHAINIAVLTYYFINWHDLTDLALIYANFIAFIISFVFSFLLNVSLFKIRLDFQHLYKSMKFAFPEIPSMAIGAIYSSFDKSLLSNYGGSTSIGNYEFGGRFASILKHFMDALSKSWGPFFMNNAEENSLSGKKRIVDTYYSLLFLFGFIGLVISFFSEEALILLTTEEFYKAKYLIPIFIIKMLFGGALSFLAINQIMYAGKLIYQFPVTIINVILNIALNIMLIPKYGAIGAVISTAVDTIIGSIIFLCLGEKAYPLLNGYKIIVKFFLLISLSLISLYVIFYFNFSIYLAFFIKLLIILIYSFLSLRIFFSNFSHLVADTRKLFRSLGISIFN